MKIALTLSILILSQFAFAKPVAVPNQKFFYLMMAKSFPNAVEGAGGFSASLDLKNLLCGATNVISDDGTPRVQVGCSARAIGTEMLHVAKNPSELFLVLLNAGFIKKHNTISDATYIVIKKINCFRTEEKPVSPEDDPTTEYSCDVSIE